MSPYIWVLIVRGLWKGAYDLMTHRSYRGAQSPVDVLAENRRAEPDREEVERRKQLEVERLRQLEKERERERRERKRNREVALVLTVATLVTVLLIVLVHLGPFQNGHKAVEPTPQQQAQPEPNTAPTTVEQTRGSPEADGGPAASPALDASSSAGTSTSDAPPGQSPVLRGPANPDKESPGSGKDASCPDGTDSCWSAGKTQSQAPAIPAPPVPETTHPQTESGAALPPKEEQAPAPTIEAAKPGVTGGDSSKEGFPASGPPSQLPILGHSEADQGWQRFAGHGYAPTPETAGTPAPGVIQGKVSGTGSIQGCPVVVLVDELPGKGFDPMPQRSVDLRHGSSVPQVMVVAKGTTIDFLNGSGNRGSADVCLVGFNNKIYSIPGGAGGSLRFDNTGVARLNCSPRGGAGTLVIVPTRYFAVTDEKGEFEIRNIPVGRYSIRTQRTCGVDLAPNPGWYPAEVSIRPTYLELESTF